MRAEKAEWLQGRNRVPLVVRARFEKTFFGLGAFAAMILLLVGGYLMREALVDPLGASDAGVLASGFVLALSGFLLAYLAWPNKRLELARREQTERVPRARRQPGSRLYGSVMREHAAKQALGEGRDLPGPM